MIKRFGSKMRYEEMVPRGFELIWTTRLGMLTKAEYAEATKEKKSKKTKAFRAAAKQAVQWKLPHNAVQEKPEGKVVCSDKNEAQAKTFKRRTKRPGRV